MGLIDYRSLSVSGMRNWAGTLKIEQQSSSKTEVFIWRKKNWV